MATTVQTFANGDKLNREQAAHLAARYKTVDGWKIAKAVVDTRRSISGVALEYTVVAGKVLLSDGSVIEASDIRYAVKVRNVNGYQDWTSDARAAGAALLKAQAGVVDSIKETGKAAQQKDKVLTIHDEYEAHMETKTTPASIDNNKRYVGSFIKTLPVNLLPVNVTAQHVTDWFAGLVAQGKTVNVANTAYRHVIGFLGDGHCNLLQEQFKKFPMLHDLKHEFTPAENTKDHTDHFTPAEQAALRAAAEPGRETVMLEIGLQLGLREAEIINAKWENVNFHTRTYTVPANMGMGKRTKSRKGRTIRFGNGLAAILKVWKETNECKGQSAYILCGDSGKARWRQELLDPVKKIAERAGIDPKDAWVHKLRHSAITSFLHAGLPPVDCQRWAGHAKLETTCLYFGNLEDKEVTKRLDSFFR